MKEPQTRFIKVRCQCKNEQIIFDRLSTKVECLVCNKVIATPTGGKAKIKADILEILS